MTGNAGSTLEALLLWWTTSCTVWLCGVLNSGAAMLSAAVVIYHVQGCSQQAVPVRLAGCVTENVSGMQHQGLLGSGHDGGQQCGSCQARSHMNPSVLRVRTNK